MSICHTDVVGNAFQAEEAAGPKECTSSVFMQLQIVGYGVSQLGYFQLQVSGYPRKRVMSTRT